MLGATTPALAGQAEVRDVALANNCAPKKIEVYKSALGAGGDIVYRAQCALPKAVGAASTEGGEQGKPPDGLLIRCVQNLCQMLRPVAIDAK